MPCFSTSSCTRRSPTYSEPIIAFRSPYDIRGVRTLAMMMFQTASTSSPGSTILSGGMRRPSWKTSVASPAKPPGTLPPTSVMCPMQAV